jgi:hypothetical protein
MTSSWISLVPSFTYTTALPHRTSGLQLPSPVVAAAAQSDRVTPDSSERPLVRQLPATPRNTMRARDNLIMSSSARRPTRSPSFDRGTVVILSTINRLDSRIPVTSLASTSGRINGASVGSVVRAQTVTDAVASNRSS